MAKQNNDKTDLIVILIEQKDCTNTDDYSRAITLILPNF